MAWNKIKKLLESIFRPKTMKDLGVKIELSVLTPNGIITKDVSNQVRMDGNGLITLTRRDFVSRHDVERTVIGVQLVDRSKMRSGMEQGEKE